MASTNDSTDHSTELPELMTKDLEVIEEVIAAARLVAGNARNFLTSTTVAWTYIDGLQKALEKLDEKQD
jgi:hypothetical protein